MPRDIDLPVTPDGNDFADFDQDTLDQVNQQIDQQAALSKAGVISPAEAREYIDLYERLKVSCAIRGQDAIKCATTNNKYQACLAVLGDV